MHFLRRWKINRLLKALNSYDDEKFEKILKTISFDLEDNLLELVRDRGERISDSEKEYSNRDRQRALAFVALGKLKSKKVEPELAKMLDEICTAKDGNNTAKINILENSIIYEAMLECIDLLENKQLIDKLPDLIKNSKLASKLKKQAFRILCKGDSVKIKDFLVTLLIKEDKNYDLETIIDRLSELEDERAIKPISRYLGLTEKFQTGRIRGEGPYKIFEPVGSEFERPTSLAATASKALVKFGSKAVPILLDLLKDENWRVRYATLDTLVKISDPETLNEITKLKDDKEERVRKMAQKAIENLSQ